MKITDEPVFSTTRSELALALRDLMHSSPLNRCDAGSDTCDTHALALEWADDIIEKVR